MTELEEKNEKIKNDLVPDVPIEQAAIKDISQEVVRLKKELSSLRQENKNIIIGALVALGFVVLTVAIEVIIFHTSNSKDFLDMQNRNYQEIRNIESNRFQGEIRIQKEIDELKNKLQK